MNSSKIVEIKNAKNDLSFTYSYDAYDKLASSKDFDGHSTKYKYNLNQVGTPAEGLLTEIIDPLDRKIQFEYYQNGKVFKEVEPGNAVQTYQYAPYVFQKYTRVTSPSGHTTEYRYDDKFRINQIVYPNRARKFQRWNEYGRIDFERDPLGYETLYTYDSRGNRTGVRRPMDSSFRSVAYNQVFDKPTQIVPLVGGTMNFQIDAQTGDTLMASSSLGSSSVSSNYLVNDFGRIEGVQTALGAYSNLSNEDGFPKYVFHSQNPSEQKFDKRGRVVQKIYRSGQILSYSYDNSNRVVSLVDTHGPDFSFQYDAVGRLIKSFRFSNGQKDVQSYEYDLRDRLISKVNYSGERSEFKYDTVGVGCNIQDKVVRAVDPLGRVTRYEYNYAGQITKEVLPDGTVTLYRYNLRGDLTTVIDGAGLAIQFEYDGNGRLVKTLRQSASTVQRGTSPEFRSVSDIEIRTYDQADRLLTVSQKLVSESIRQGEYLTEFTYDDLSRVVRKRITHRQDGQVLEEFDDIEYEYLNLLDQNLVSQIKNKYVILNFKYQPQPPYSLVWYSVTPTSEGSALGLEGSRFRIDPAISGPEGSIYMNGALALRNTYGPSGDLIGVLGKLNETDHSVEIQRDGLKRKVQVTHSTGAVGSYSYDKMGRPVSVGWANGPFPMSQTLVYSASGLLTQNSREFGDFGYTYNTRNEVTGFTYSGPALPSPWPDFTNTSLNYDVSGNRTSYRDQTYLSFSNFHHKLNQPNSSYTAIDILPDDGGLGRVFKRSGPQLTNPTYSYMYSELSYYPSGQIKELIKGNGYNVRYIYDGLGRRILKIYNPSTAGNGYTLEYIHRGLSDRVLYTRSKWINGSRETLFADGSGIDEHLFEIDSSSGVEVYQTDYLGSVLNPDLNSKEGYGLFGEVVGSLSLGGLYPTLEYGYSGREYERDTGLYYFRARYYDPEMGRFLTKDPIGLAGGHTNLYLYCGNDPVNCVDPMGLKSFEANLADRRQLQSDTAEGIIKFGVGVASTSAFLRETTKYGAIGIREFFESGGSVANLGRLGTAIGVAATAGAKSVLIGGSFAVGYEVGNYVGAAADTLVDDLQGAGVLSPEAIDNLNTIGFGSGSPNCP